MTRHSDTKVRVDPSTLENREAKADAKAARKTLRERGSVPYEKAREKLGLKAGH